MRRVRFAPSPTGQLHVGNARTALFNWLLARGQGGTFILRIEDTDFERSTRESERGILDDLRWLGLDWDEGVDVGGDHGPYRSPSAAHLSRACRGADGARDTRITASARRAARGRSPGRARGGLPPKYVGTLPQIPRDDARPHRERRAGGHPLSRARGRDVTSTTSFAASHVHTDVIGDPVLVRSDGIPAYNYAVVIDDALMEITHVIRGEDHISNTPRQMLLYEAFGWRRRPSRTCRW